MPLEEFRNAIDPRELWRGEIQMRERKVTAFISSPCTNGEGLWTLLLVQLKSMPGSVREDVLDWHQVVEFSTVMQTVHLLLAVAPELHTATENCRSLVQLVQLLSFIRFLLGVMSVVTEPGKDHGGQSTEPMGTQEHIHYPEQALGNYLNFPIYKTYIYKHISK